MKKKTIVIYVVLFVWAGFTFTEVTGQEDVFNTKFPELQSSLKPDGSVNIDNSNTEMFRNMYQKLGESCEEIEKFKLGGASPENLVVFEFRELKSLGKSEKLEDLKKKILKNQQDIKILMSNKTKYGVDSVECLEQLSIFSSLIKQKDYENAYKPWRLLYLLSYF